MLLLGSPLHQDEQEKLDESKIKYTAQYKQKVTACLVTATSAARCLQTDQFTVFPPPTILSTLLWNFPPLLPFCPSLTIKYPLSFCRPPSTLLALPPFLTSWCHCSLNLVYRSFFSLNVLLLFFLLFFNGSYLNDSIDWLNENWYIWHIKTATQNLACSQCHVDCECDTDFPHAPLQVNNYSDWPSVNFLRLSSRWAGSSLEASISGV